MGNRKGWVYGLFDVREPEIIRYVGKTVGRRGVKYRVYQHVWGSLNRYVGMPSQRWIRKIGAENLGFTVLDEVNFSEVDSAEMQWISDTRNRGMADLNILAGGDGVDSEFVTGEGNPKSKLTWRDVREIRARATRSYVSAAREATVYGVTPAAMSKVLRNFTWYDPEYDPGQRVTIFDFNSSAPENPVWRRFSDQEVEDIRDCYMSGERPADIATRLGAGLTSVRRVLFEKYGSEASRIKCVSRKNSMRNLP